MTTEQEQKTSEEFKSEGPRIPFAEFDPFSIAEHLSGWGLIDFEEGNRWLYTKSDYEIINGDALDFEVRIARNPTPGTTEQNSVRFERIKSGVVNLMVDTYEIESYTLGRLKIDSKPFVKFYQSNGGFVEIRNSGSVFTGEHSRVVLLTH